MRKPTLIAVMFVIVSLLVGGNVRPVAAGIFSESDTVFCDHILFTGNTGTTGLVATIDLLSKSPTLHVPIHVNGDGSFSQSVGFSAPIGSYIAYGIGTGHLAIVPACSSGPVTFFNPGDGRLSPQPGDRIAVYCNKATGDKPANLAVFGINSSSVGTQIADPTLSDIAGAGKSFSDGQGGTVFIGGQAPTFVIQWANSAVGATGQGDYVKTVTCVG